MSDITTIFPEYLPAPDRWRKDHEPQKGNIYRDRSDEEFIRIGEVARTLDDGHKVFCCEEYDFLRQTWVPSHERSRSSLDEYYTLVIGREGAADETDWKVIATMAELSLTKDNDTIKKTFDEIVSACATKDDLALVAQNDAKRVYSLTERAERMQDKLDTIRCAMRAVIAQKRREMEERLSILDKSLSKLNEQVRNLYRVITVMNLYTGRNVELQQICDGEPAPDAEPIHVRQRILFANEEYMADAVWGGIDFQKMDEFYQWLSHPANRDIVLPEQKCIVALKPRRHDIHYSSSYIVNEAMNTWNRHTIILFRNGEKLFALDSEDLELYGTAIPYSDQAERFDKRAKQIIDRNSFVESDLERLKNESEALGYMYTKYISFLQGVVDNGVVYDVSIARPNFAKEIGVVYVHDDENAIGTGRSWKQFQKEANSKIRRGSRVVYTPLYGITPGEPNRFYMHDVNRPAPPRSGIYNVDYPTKTDYVRDPEHPGRIKKQTGKLDTLAIFYSPARTWKWNDDVKDRAEAWIYNPDCVLNYDILTIDIVDALLKDRTQRETYLEWLPILRQARESLAKEKELEDAFVLSMGNCIQREDPTIPSECIEGLVREAIGWWKKKVIFTRPLSSDDEKAWRMIEREILRRAKQEY